MIKIEMDPGRGELTIHVDDEGVDLLASMAKDANRRGPSKVLLGEAGSMLIIRHVDYQPGDD